MAAGAGRRPWLAGLALLAVSAATGSIFNSPRSWIGSLEPPLK
ncbi:MAG: hypothetical protein N838_11420 [Thiohalocapsa sp. PB-PSB1]|nr:MAG: hypothetical protein N838_11420 [Thiohalocapsa sp. PB-PSB1]